MGVLERQLTKRAVALAPRHVVGRSRAALLQLESSTISGVHALIEWSDGQGWSVRDLGSKNGTFVDGRRLFHGAAAALASGARIAFGGEDEVWHLADARAPGPVARSASGIYSFPELGMIALPSPERPELTVIVEDGRCFVEGEAGRIELVDGAPLSTPSETWTLVIPELLRETTRSTHAPSVGDLALSFFVSLDEENVELLVTGGGLDVRVPHRSHHYLLLTLARRRLDDAVVKTLPAGEHGWIDAESLQQMLRLDPEQMNLLVFRARRQFAEIGVRDATLLVERRPGSRQLRIGIDRVAVARA